MPVGDHGEHGRPTAALLQRRRHSNLVARSAWLRRGGPSTCTTLASARDEGRGQAATYRWVQDSPSSSFVPSSFARSTRSCGRPAIRFIVASPSRETTIIRRPCTSNALRPAHTSSSAAPTRMRSSDSKAFVSGSSFEMRWISRGVPLRMPKVIFLAGTSNPTVRTTAIASTRRSARTNRSISIVARG